MGELKQGAGETDEWYTPPWLFEALNCRFDLDPCSPSQEHWTPADIKYTKKQDGLIQDWSGFVFMNPPFGGRNGHVPWLEKFIVHNNGIAIVRAYTSSGWWHEYVPLCSGVLFPKGKTKFIRSDGTEGKSPSSGIALLACGSRAEIVLKSCGLGMYMKEEAR